MARQSRGAIKQATPILSWPGKQPPAPPPPARMQRVELFAACSTTQPPAGGATIEPGNALFLGDNHTVLAHLLDHGLGGKVKLIYIDPPFDTGSSHRRKIRLRIPKAPTMQTNADAIVGEEMQYYDRWEAGSYLQFIYERLPLLRELLADDGSLWLHCDHRQAHHLRLLLQEVFGADNYLNTVIWRSQVARGAKVNAFYFPFSAHYLEIFAKNRRTPTTWNPPKKQIVLNEEEAERSFMRDNRGFFRTSDPGTYSFTSLKALYAEGRLYAPFGGQPVIDEARQRIYPSRGGNLAVKYYLTELGRGKWALERAVDNLWDDIPGLGITPGEDLGYPTQKTTALLERVIRTATNPGDLVLDCFMGSGTTLAVAQRLGRRWIGCDNSSGALQTTRRRLQALAGAAPSGDDAFAVYRMAGALPSPAMPPQAQVRIERDPAQPATVVVELLDLSAPAVEELMARSGLGRVSEVGWRAVVDCVAIDPAYNGEVFCSRLVDAPLKKSAQVAGRYLFSAAQPTVVAVRVTDLLGGETIHTAMV